MPAVTAEVGFIAVGFDADVATTVTAAAPLRTEGNNVDNVCGNFLGRRHH